MPRKKKSDLSQFEDLLKSVGYDNVEQHEGVTDVTQDIFDDDDIENLDPENQTSPVQKTEEVDNQQVTKDPLEDTTPVPEDVLNRQSEQQTNEGLGEQNDDDNVEEVDPTEATNIGAFFDAFAEELGWDVADDEKPNSVEGLVDYIGSVIEQNSTPKYADDRIAQLDNYVKNGGRFEDFYQRQQDALSLDNLDIEDESNQKAAVRELYRLQGYDDEQISRRIERFEDADMLEEEAQDAVERLRTIRTQQLEQARQQQEQARQAQEAQARQFMEDLTGSINSLDNIRGISIPKQDRKALYDYITKVDADGLTQYQKDFNSNMVNNLIESAYFTMKGDALLGEATRSGRTSAANKLRTMLRHTSTNHSRYNVQEDKQRSVVDIASRFYN